MFHVFPPIVHIKQISIPSLFSHLLRFNTYCRHSFFLKMMSDGEKGAHVPGTKGVVAKKAVLPQSLTQVRDLPIFKEADFLSVETQ